MDIAWAWLAVHNTNSDGCILGNDAHVLYPSESIMSIGIRKKNVNYENANQNRHQIIMPVPVGLLTGHNCMRKHRYHNRRHSRL